MMKGVNFQFTATNKAAPAMQSFQNGLKGVSNQMRSATAANQSFMRGMSDNRRAVQQLGFQIADFSVQVAGGQNKMLAFAQQGGQILQFFGAFGAVAGAALAVFAAWAISTGAFTSDTEKLSDAMKPLNDDFSKYTDYITRSAEKTADLTERFGNFASQIKAFSTFMGGVQLAKTFDDLKATIEPLKTGLSGVLGAYQNVVAAQQQISRAQVDGITTAEQLLQMQEAAGVYQDTLDAAVTSLGLNTDEALRLASAMDAIGRAKSMDEVAVAAGEALAIMRQIAPTGLELPTPLREAAAALEEMQRNAAAASTATHTIKIGFDDAAVAAANVVDNVRLIGTSADGAIGAVKRLGLAMWDAAQARLSAQNQLDQMKMEFSPGGQAMLAYGGRTATAGQVALGKKYDMFGNLITDKIPGGAGAGAGRGGGGGGGGAQDVLADLQKQLELETALLGKTEAQQRVIRALGPDWQKYGDVVINGLTGQIEAIEAFNQKMADQQSIANTIKSSMEDAFMGIVSGTMKAKDAFKSMAASIISELFRIMVVQKMVNSILGFFGLGGTGAVAAPITVPSANGGGYTGYGARSGGVDGKGGFLSVLHPDETILDHTKGQGAGGVVVNQTISFGSGVTRAEVQSMIPKIVDATKAAVLDARKRGGSYGSAFA